MAQVHVEDPVLGTTGELTRVVRRAYDKPNSWPSAHIVGYAGPPDLQGVLEAAEVLEAHDRILVIAGIDVDDGEVLYLAETEAERAVSVLEAMLKSVGTGRTDAYAVAATYYEIDAREAQLVQSIHPGASAEVADDGEGDDDVEADDEDTDLPAVDDDEERVDFSDDESDVYEDDDPDPEDNQGDEEDGGDDDASESEETAWVVKVEIARTKVRTGRTAAA